MGKERNENGREGGRDEGREWRKPRKGKVSSQFNFPTSTTTKCIWQAGADGRCLVGLAETHSLELSPVVCQKWHQLEAGIRANTWTRTLRCRMTFYQQSSLGQRPATWTPCRISSTVMKSLHPSSSLQWPEDAQATYVGSIITCLLSHDKQYAYHRTPVLPLKSQFPGKLQRQIATNALVKKKAWRLSSWISSRICLSLFHLTYSYYLGITDKTYGLTLDKKRSTALQSAHSC